MQISVTNPETQTILFGIVCFIFIFLFSRMSWGSGELTTKETNEMRGYAMLAIVVSHIGYFLSTDSTFLFPFSIGAGVAVNLFFLLSGYGLVFSKLKKETKVVDFYKRRILKIVFPVWITLGVLYLLDFFILQKTYSSPSIIQSFFLWFGTADIWNNVNSPLWYLTILFLFYLVFPLLFSKSAPFVSVFLLVLFGWILSYFAPEGVSMLWGAHWLVFPLGALLGVFVSKKKQFWRPVVVFESIIKRRYLRIFVGFIALALAIIGLRYFSGVGGVYEQYISIGILFLYILSFILIPIRSKTVEIVGRYSFGIYLVHWPLMYRYGFWFSYMPAWLSAILGIVMSLILAWVIQRITELAKIG